ncbi:MAG: CopD family protein [Chitinophagales bacterium]
MHHVLIVIHLLAATIWIGGHLILSIRYLPQALRDKNPEIIRAFEAKYETIGLPSLLLLVITGVMLAYVYGVSITHWFSFSNPIERSVSVKLVLLLTTLVLAVHARIFIIPKLSQENMTTMALHIIAITTVAVLMLITGSTVRFGGI